MNRTIIRISERYISPMNEFRIKEIMADVEHRMKRKNVPGLTRVETLVDRNDPNRFVVITEWRSRRDLSRWTTSELCQRVIKDLEPVLDRKPTYREFVRHEDDVFLL